MLIDVRLAHLQTPYQHWPAPKTYGPASSPWTKANLGEVYGVTFDQAGNVYVSATTVYGNGTPGGPGGSGAIYKMNNVTGSITTFAMLPNTGCGLGNIAWDDANNQMFATNFEDGKIYRLSSTGTILSTFDPFAADGGSSGAAPLEELLWGIGVYNGRVYFGRWNEHSGSPSSVMNNQIWSIGLLGGNFSGVAQLEINVPSLPSSNYSNPVADISFSAAGRMLFGERTMGSHSPMSPGAHASRVLEYSLVGMSWLPTGNLFGIGLLGSNDMNSSGGVDYAYGSSDPSTGEIIDCDDAVWATGDALKFVWATDFIYGFQRLPASGGSAPGSVMIDADGVTNMASNQDKTQIGDIEVFKQCNIDPPPCDGIEVSLSQLSSDECCYELSISGIPSPSDFTSVTATLVTSGVTFSGVVGPLGWNVTNSATTATWDLAGTIPSGSSNGLEFCISTTVSAPQQVLITLHRKDGTVCEYLMDLDCEPPAAGPCVVVNDFEIECVKQGPQGWVYEISFTVTNYSPFSQSPWSLPAANLLVFAPLPLSITPSASAISPTLSYGQTSGTLNYTLTGPGLQPGDEICIDVQLHGAKVGDDYRWCCPPEEYCFELPPCRDCCDSTDISITNSGGKQIGNTAASLSSTVAVSPKPIMKVQASVMSVDRSRVWCPNSSGVYVPVSGPTSIGALITGASISPVMPVSAGLTPPTSEVIWGTVYSGVNINPGSIGLNLSFPGTNLGWRCQDTLNICVRYSFTDTSWVTCDTVVYYRIPRCGRIDIVKDPGPIGVPVSFDEAIQGTGVSIGEPLYSDVVEGPVLALNLSSQTAGTLAVSHWWQDAVVGSDKVRLIRMHVVPEAGIKISSLRPRVGGEGATIVDKKATIAMSLAERETDEFTVAFENPTRANFFSLRVTFDYVDVDEPDMELESREYVVYGDVNGGSTQGRIEVVEASKSNPILYKLLIGSNANHSADWIAPACFRFTPPEGMRILASGPMPDSLFAEFHVLKSLSNASSVLMQLPNQEEYHKDYIAQEKTLELWLVLEGKASVFDLDWEAMNMDGSLIGEGSVELNPSSTVHDGDGFVPGATIQLLEAYPNPTDGGVTARFNLTRSETVSVAVFDLAGNEVTQLLDGQRLNAGSYEYELNLKSLPSGVYYIRLTTDAGTQTKSVVRK